MGVHRKRRAIEQKFYFTNNKVTNLLASEISERYWIQSGESISEITPDEPPVFIGGKSWFYYYFWSSMRYPADARRNGIQGKVFISATITKDGKLINESVEEGPGFGLNEEALKVFDRIPDDWLPAKVKGEAVDIMILVPVTFRLN